MRKSFSLLTFLSLLISSHALAQVDNKAIGCRLQAIGPNISASSSQITISEYCLFLNVVATTDPCGLYDEKMDGIIRSGAPCSYTYSVAVGAEEKPINYIDHSSEKWYFNWLDSSASSFSSCNLFPVTCELFSASTSTFNFNLARTSGLKIDLAIRSNRCALDHASISDVASDLTKKNNGDEANVSLLGAAAKALTVAAVVFGAGQDAEREAMERRMMAAEDRRESSTEAVAMTGRSCHSSSSSDRMAATMINEGSHLRLTRTLEEISSSSSASQGAVGAASGEVAVTTKSGHLGTSEVKITALPDHPPSSYAPGASSLRSASVATSQLPQVTQVLNKNQAARTNRAGRLQIIISDNALKAPHSLGQKLSDIYATECDLMESTFVRPTLPAGVKETDPLLKYQGFTCLSNHTGACKMNAAIQHMRICLEIEFQQETPEKKQALETKLRVGMPEFWKFLQGNCNTEEDCRKLHAEMSHIITYDYWRRFCPEEERPRASEKSDDAHRCSQINLHAILGQALDISKICIEESTTPKDGTTTIKHYSSNAKWLRRGNQEKSSFFSSSADSIQKILKHQEEQSEEEGIKICLEDPVPSSIHLYSEDHIHHLLPYQLLAPGVLKPITIPHKNGGVITYQPKSIQCSTANLLGAHAYCIIKKNDIWYEVNDSVIIPIPKAWEKDLDAYCAKHGASVVYEKKEEGSNTAPLSATESQESGGGKMSQEEWWEVIKASQRLAEAFPLTDFPIFLKLNELGIYITIPDLLSFNNDSFLGQQFLSKNGSVVIEDGGKVLATQITADMTKAEMTPNIDEALDFYEEAIQKAVLLETLYAQRVDNAEALSTQVPEATKAFWNTILQDSKNNQALASSRLLACKARKATLLPSVAFEKAMTALDGDAVDVSLLDQAIQASKDAVTDCDESARFDQEAQKQGLQQFKNSWSDVALKEREYNRNAWQTNSEALIALRGVEVASTTEPAIARTLLDEALPKAHVAEGAWKQLAEHYQKSMTPATPGIKGMIARAETMRDSWAEKIGEWETGVVATEVK